MESNYKSYNSEASRNRIDSYLDASDGLFEELDEIPARSKLTYNNGFYIKHCTALFVDIRESSSLPDKYTRPRLAKIYRSYISEVVSIINSNTSCKEINIVGDCVNGIFNTPYKTDVDGVFSTAARINTIINILNCKLEKRKIDPIKIGVGIDYGRLLMIQAGYNGSGINDVVWMGNAVNNASKLCHHGNQTYNDKVIMLSDVIYANLSDTHQNMVSRNHIRYCYHANVVDSELNTWFENNCV